MHPAITHFTLPKSCTFCCTLLVAILTNINWQLLDFTLPFEGDISGEGGSFLFIDDIAMIHVVSAQDRSNKNTQFD